MSPDAEATFQSLKESHKTPVVGYPWLGEKFIIDMHVSNMGIGCVLSQEHEVQECVVVYCNRTPSKAKGNYCMIQLELLAIVMMMMEHSQIPLWARISPVDQLVCPVLAP